MKRKSIFLVKLMGLIIVTLITFNINYYSFAIEPGNNVIRRNTVNFTTGTYDGTESDGSASYGAILEKEKNNEHI